MRCAIKGEGRSTPLVGAAIAPHPPIIIPEIGGGRASEAVATIEAMRLLAQEVAACRPELLLFSSPHSPRLARAFVLRAARRLQGSFAQFGRADVSMTARSDLEFGSEIAAAAGQAGLPASVVDKEGSEAPDLDWGVLVPYHYLGAGRSLVALSISDLSALEHLEFGRAVGSVCNADPRRIFYVASGDLSHRLTRDAPAGFSPSGEVFDVSVREIVGSGGLEGLADIDPILAEEAGECGLRSFLILAGAAKGTPMSWRILSYEAPFGVGYLVAAGRHD